MSSQAQINANRTNAQSSTGPTSTTGKATVSLNAVKTGLTGRTVLLPSDEAAQYESLMQSYQKIYSPVGPEETALLQSIIDTVWRLDRIPALEISLINMGRRAFAEKYPDEAGLDQATIEMWVRLEHEKEFRNLQIQENRLVRRRNQETAELRRLQQQRKAQETKDLDQAALAYLAATQRNQPFVPAEIGFEFSTQQIESYIAKLTPAQKQQLLDEALKGDAKTAQAAA